MKALLRGIVSRRTFASLIPDCLRWGIRLPHPSRGRQLLPPVAKLRFAFGPCAVPAFAPPEGLTAAASTERAPADVESRRMFGLDVIRASAIALVLLAHTIPRKAALGLDLDAINRLRLALGFIGVELFFVLSGFLIGGILLREIEKGRFESRRDLVNFWKRRWFRTLPIYLVFLALNAAVFWMENGVAPLESWRFLTFTQSFAQPHPEWFREAWSLSVEEWFYLLFPIALLGLRKIWAGNSRSFIVCTLLFMCLPMAFRAVLALGDWDHGVRKITVLRLDTIMFGVGLAYLSQQRPALWKFARAAWPAGLLGTVAVVVYLAGRTPQADSMFDRIFLFTLTSFSLAALLPAISRWSEPHALLARPIACLSLWSYSLYLCHGLINNYLRPGLAKVCGIELGKESLLRCIAVWIIAITVAAVLHRFVEKPMTSLREKF